MVVVDSNLSYLLIVSVVASHLLEGLGLNSKALVLWDVEFAR